MLDNYVRRARETKGVSLDDNALTGSCLRCNGDVLSVDGHAARGGDDAADIEDDGSRARGDGEGIAEGAFFL